MRCTAPTPATFQCGSFAAGSVIALLAVAQGCATQTPHRSANVATREFEKTQREALWDATGDSNAWGRGASTFHARCAPCHKRDASGLIGPNPTDAEWIHGGTQDAVYSTIKNGWPEKGMPGWKSILRPADIAELVVFLTTARPAPNEGDAHDS